MKIDCSKHQLKKIGEKLRHGNPLSQEDEKALADFRVGHRNIIEAFRNQHNTLLKKSPWNRRSILFASRLKKRQTIRHKLSSRHQQMDLSRMHDIAGCRLIFLTLNNLVEYRTKFLEKSKKNNHYVRLYDDNRYDYIAHPRDTGYRSIHDVYEEVTDDSIKAKIEVQYRTLAQHSWATALEIWDQSHAKGAKFGLEDPEIQGLFRLYSELLWRFTDWDGTPGTREKNNLTDEELYNAISANERRLHVLDELSKVKGVQMQMSFKSDKVLLQRNVSKSSPLQDNVMLEARQLSWDQVASVLFENELNDANDWVFVQTNPKILRRAYNNYFDDTKGFVKRIRAAMQKLYEKEGKKRFVLFRRPLDSVFSVQ